MIAFNRCRPTGVIWRREMISLAMVAVLMLACDGGATLTETDSDLSDARPSIADDARVVAWYREVTEQRIGPLWAMEADARVCLVRNGSDSDVTAHLMWSALDGDDTLSREGSGVCLSDASSQDAVGARVIVLARGPGDLSPLRLLVIELSERNGTGG